ncbi:TlpA disulfide reductase family protein [Corynebacterium alimapuense]|uniref:Effector protein n=1 Tax=Corynebacterium alimapuense TaxID=1576874 RepID=A0A3M8K6V7_9CORY|nr:TlpA disulfide reductase family protein [Corynebacterium alimapuense]RNE48947.1 effector protein [Corynebacterium alimapuense]
MRRTSAAALLLAPLLLLSACADSESAQNAVAVGGTFQFHSPGGQTEIFYEEDERAQLQSFSGDSLMEEGETISLDDFAGEVVVLNAWGQWCAPCRSESDDLQLVQETLEPLGGTVLGVNVRDYNQTIAQDFVTDNGLTYPSIYDPPFRTAASLGGVPTSVIPTTIVLDTEHRPVAVFLREVTADDILDVALPLAEGSEL